MCSFQYMNGCYHLTEALAVWEQSASKTLDDNKQTQAAACTCDQNTLFLKICFNFFKLKLYLW